MATSHDTGAGASRPPLVLVHGNPENDAVWGPVLDVLDRDDVFMLSPPGFGTPMAHGFQATVAGYRGWLEARLEAFGVPVDLVGHDWASGRSGSLASPHRKGARKCANNPVWPRPAVYNSQKGKDGHIAGPAGAGRWLRVHHSHSSLAVFFTAAGVAVVFTALMATLAVLVQRSRNAGPLQEQWLKARGNLTFRQRRELWRANVRGRLVKRADLAPAQFAWTRYAAESLRRAPITRHRWLRITFPVAYLALTASQLAQAFSGPHIHIVNLIGAAGFLDAGAVFTYMGLRGTRRAGKKIDHLQQQLRYRFGQYDDAVLS